MDDLAVIDEIQKLQPKKKNTTVGRSCLLHLSNNPNFLLVSLKKWGHETEESREYCVSFKQVNCSVPNKENR